VKFAVIILTAVVFVLGVGLAIAATWIILDEEHDRLVEENIILREQISALKVDACQTKVTVGLAYRDILANVLGDLGIMEPNSAAYRLLASIDEGLGGPE
jgi:hypothetical protein